jgi:hypothetical protein
MTRSYHGIPATQVKTLAVTPICSRKSQPGSDVFRWVTTTVYRNSRRALCVALVISLLATSTPAASQTIISVSRKWHVGLGFWLRSNDVPAKLYRALTPKGAKQEKQKDRDERVNRIQIYPGDLTVNLSDHLWFSAVPYDRDNAPVSGVKIKWSGQNSAPGSRVRISPTANLKH